MDSMDCSDVSWLSEMGLDNSIFMDQCDSIMDAFDDEIAAVLGQDLETYFSAGKNSPSSSTLINNIPSTTSITSMCNSPNCTESLQVAAGSTDQPPPAKLQKLNNFSGFSTMQTNQEIPNSSTPIILNFGNAAENPQNSTTGALNPDEEAAVSEVLSRSHQPEEQLKRVQPAKKTGRVRPPSQTYDHIIAERKRREQLSQRFVLLSTIVPGLKKMDKTSVLGDAINYLKHLQERVKTLEEQAAKHTMESVVLVKRSQIIVEDEGSSDEKSGCSDEQPLPEIEARVCNNQILLRVHGEKQKGILVHLLSNVEKLNLAVINTNVIPFGTLALNITIVTEMEKEFNLTVKEVVKRLCAALQLKY